MGCVLVLVALAAMPARGAEPTHRVGLATVGITPPYPVRLSGFGSRSRESQGVRLPIHARALAIGPLGREPTAGPEPRGDGCVVMIVVETLGIPAGITERLAARLATRGIARENLALCATHTHSAPMVRDCAPTLFGKPIPAAEWGRILAHTADLEAKLEEVALAALADLEPATLGHATGRLGFAFNRRTPGGPVDHDLPLLVVRAPDGALRGLFSTYACHAVTLSDDLVSGDWVGYAMHHLERRHPGCTALVSIGCGADANPRGGVLGGATEAADLLGREYADEIDRLLAGAVRPITALPVGRLDRVALALAPLPSRAEWESRAGQGGAVGHHARTQLERLDRGEALATTIDHPVQSIAFGAELAWVFLAGEVVVDYATRLKQQLDGGRVWLHAYANACPGYVPSERILREGGYEGGGAMIYYDIPGPYAVGLEEKLVGAVTGQLAARFADGRGAVGPALESFRVAPGFRVELVAAEPMVHSPVAVAFGPDRRTWVAEMIDYPSGLPDGRPAGRVRCLHDDDGDGRPDRATTFLDGIPFPTGVTPWRDGLLVCAAPDILLARDGDGDGHADAVEPLFTGFATHNAQARVNGLEAGLDGWLEGACGLFGGRITSVRTGDVVDLGGRDFRIDPDRGLLEPLVGASQQGRVRDDEGNWFGCHSGALAIHFPLRHEWLRRNPLVAARRLAVPIAAEPGPGDLFPVSQPELFALSGPVGRPTAACGLAVYRDDLLGADGTPFTGDLFTCEPAQNLVHHQRPAVRGASFTGARVAAERDREFLASTDPRFRPVQVRTAPDGSLWVVDMARSVIEHPDWIPPDTRATLDLRGGADRGRIWRVVAVDGAGAPVRRPVPRLDRLVGAELAAALDTPNGTVRDLVQQAISWRTDHAAVPTLTRLAVESPRAAVRLQAVATLALLGSLPDDLLASTLADPSPAVRRQGVRLAGRGAIGRAQAAAVARLAADPAAAVRLEVAAVADRLPEDSAAEVLVYLAERQGDDAIVEAVLASSLSPGSARAVAKTLAARGAAAPLTPALETLLLHAARRVDAVALAEWLATARGAATPEPSAAALDHLARFVAAAAARPDGALQPDANRWRDC
ncbi:MAG: dehydrogenase, partial [Planctomycetes bacterium]|nr:dehydrogenase [Planctomycetota bacterium]